MLTIVGVKGMEYCWSMLFMRCIVRFSDVCIWQDLQQKHIQNTVKHLRWRWFFFEKHFFLVIWQGSEYTSVHVKQREGSLKKQAKIKLEQEWMWKSDLLFILPGCWTGKPILQLFNKDTPWGGRRYFSQHFPSTFLFFLLLSTEWI